MWRGGGGAGAGEGAGEVHAEEREARIGHRVDGIADEEAALRLYFVVFAAKWDDLEIGFAARHARDDVAIEPSAVDNIAGANRSGGGFDDVGVAVVTQAGDFGVKDDFAAAGGDQLGVLVGDVFVIHDAGGGHEQGADAVGVRFKFAELVALEQAQAGDSVGDSALMQFLKARDFVGSGGDDQLAALLVGNGVLGAEALHGGASGDAVARLERAGAVVEAGVNDAAVVSGLVGGDAVFFLDD